MAADNRVASASKAIERNFGIDLLYLPKKEFDRMIHLYLILR